MAFPVSWTLAGFGQSEYLTDQLQAAEYLEQRGFHVCIVSDVATRVYGSDTAIRNLSIAVANGEIESALGSLQEIGYQEIPGELTELDKFYKRHSGPWPGHILSKSPREIKLLLFPASIWNLETDSKDWTTNTVLFPGSRCRFPSLQFYVHGNTQKSSIESPTNFHSFNLYCCATIVRQPTEWETYQRHPIRMRHYRRSPSSPVSCHTTRPR